MNRKSYIITIMFILCLGLILMGCPKKMVVKEEPSIAQQETARQEAERAAREREAREREAREREAREREAREREIRERDLAKAKEREEQAKKEFEKGLVPKKEPAIAGEVFESKMLKMIHFDFDRYDICPIDAEILKGNAVVLNKFPTVRIQIEGHCDERGTQEYNLALGERRANSTKRYLVSLGIAADRISTISYGEEKPLDPAHNEEAWAKNRRAHFVITAK